MRQVLLSTVLLVGLLGSFTPAFGGPLRDRIEERLESRRVAAQAEDTGELDPDEQSTTGVRLPPNARLERDLPYGNDPQQRLDVYLPAQAKGAPIIFMVHGGAWMIGDKAASGFVLNKVAHWLPKGYILVSSNYRMSRRPNPLDQAYDIAQGLGLRAVQGPILGRRPSQGAAARAFSRSPSGLPAGRRPTHCHWPGRCSLARHDRARQRRAQPRRAHAA